MRWRIDSASTCGLLPGSFSGCNHAGFVPSARIRDENYRSLTMQIIQEVLIGCIVHRRHATRLPLIAKAMAHQDVAGVVTLGDLCELRGVAALVRRADRRACPIK